VTADFVEMIVLTARKGTFDHYLGESR